MAKRLSKKQQQQRQQMILLGGGAVVALVIVAVLIFTMLPSGAELPSGVKTKYQGLQQSTTAQGYPQLGDPDAPILVQEFSSFTCPFCKDLHEDIISPDLMPFIEAGQVRWVFAPVDLGRDDEAEMVRAAVCASEQGKFFELHDVLFHWQGRVSFSQSRVESAADELGLNVDEFNRCYNSNRGDRVAQLAVQDMQDRGLRISPPTVLLNRNPVDPFRELIAGVNALVAGTTTEE